MPPLKLTRTRSLDYSLTHSYTHSLTPTHCLSHTEGRALKHAHTQTIGIYKTVGTFCHNNFVSILHAGPYYILLQAVNISLVAPTQECFVSFY